VINSLSDVGVGSSSSPQLVVVTISEPIIKKARYGLKNFFIGNGLMFR